MKTNSKTSNTACLKETTGGIGVKSYGYEPNYELDNFDPNIYQGANNTCALRCEEIVLRDYGIMFQQADLVKYATDGGWFNPDPERGGTDKNAVGNIIDACGIPTLRTDNANIYDIIGELRAGHRVIVNVDADELWVKQEKNLFKRLFGEAKNRVNDSLQSAIGVEGANHAVIVAGVNVNPDDPKDIHVTLIDSGTGQMCVEYTFKEFYNAWKDGCCRMVSTTIPAPFQYNYHTKEMEPSGFDTPYKPSLAEVPDGLDNKFRVSSQYMGRYQDYLPEYDGDANCIQQDSYLDDNGCEEGESGQYSEDSEDISYPAPDESSEECHSLEVIYGQELENNSENSYPGASSCEDSYESEGGEDSDIQEDLDGDNMSQCGNSYDVEQ